MPGGILQISQASRTLGVHVSCVSTAWACGMQVASDTLGVDLEPVQLHNMMARACELLQLQQPRLTLSDFTRITRHFCG